MSIQIEQDLERLAAWGEENLSAVIAIDSQSDEESEAIPSSEGQRVLSAHLQRFFAGLGFETIVDDFANLLVRIPANEQAPSCAPSLAMMVHLDTSKGTFPIPALEHTASWDGEPIQFRENKRLEVSTALYPQTEIYRGEDLMHGTGVSPIGLDDKLGMSQLMTLAQVLQSNPSWPHGELWLVFRPDEEIGRMAAVEGLAQMLVERGVKYGYTIDGLEPFEVNVENFDAARARASFEAETLDLVPQALTRSLRVEVFGVKSHGATAKAEGYRNATVLVMEAAKKLGLLDGPLLPEASIVPVAMQSQATAEVNATVDVLLRGADDAEISAARAQWLEALEAAVVPHQRRGATIEAGVLTEVSSTQTVSGALLAALQQLQDLLDPTLEAEVGAVSPILSEHSAFHQGYSNPYFLATAADGSVTLDYRLRAFRREELKAREQHIEALCARASKVVKFEIEQQYINMGPALDAYPMLLRWAQLAAAQIGVDAPKNPIRGGTGVDPFIERGLPIANLGTGYFAPESEKEFTSRQKLAQHILWLCHVVREVAQGDTTA